MDIQISSGVQSGAGVADAVRQIRSDTPAASPQPSGTVVPQAQAVAPVGSAATQEQVKNAVDKVNQVVQKMLNGSSIEFSVDQDTNVNVVKVMDKATKDVIRQFPSEEILAIAKVLDKLQGLLIKDKA